MQQRCPNCGSPVAPGQRFCGGCGAQISLACPQCRITVSPGTRFCPNCGATLGGIMHQQPGGMPPQQQPGWGQQPAGMPPQQQPGWGQQPGGMPPQQQPGWGQQPAWAPPAQSNQPSSRRTFLLILLIVLLLGLGGLVYWQFGDQLLGFLNISGGGGSGIDITAPEITNVKATAGTTNAAITWETSEPSSSQVEYGTNKESTSLMPAQPDNDPSTGASAGVVTHSVTLNNLTPSTPAGNIKYYYRVISKDAAGNEAVSDWKSFETALSDT